MEVYDWADYTRSKGAIKLHTLLDYDGLLPSFIYMSDGKGSDMRMARNIQIPANSIVVADRGYIDFYLLNKWNEEGIDYPGIKPSKQNAHFRIWHP